MLSPPPDGAAWLSSEGDGFWMLTAMYGQVAWIFEVDQELWLMLEAPDFNLLLPVASKSRAEFLAKQWLVGMAGRTVFLG